MREGLGAISEKFDHINIMADLRVRETERRSTRDVCLGSVFCGF